INICDVVVIEAISLKFPSIRSVVHQNPELFTGRRWINDESGSDVDWSQFIGENKDKNKQKWMEILPSKESDNKTVSKALKFLFPRLTSDSLNENNLDELRISASNRLQRYFALTTLEDSVDVKEIHNLLNNQELLENYLDFNPETIDRLLSDIENYIGSAEISDINTVADILIKKATSLVKNNELTHASLRSLNSIFIALINKLSPTEKNNLFIKLIERSPLSISEGILRYAISDLGLWGRNGERESENPIIADKETVIDGKNYWVSRISEEIKQPDFLNNISASSLVWCWWHLAENKTAVVDTLKAFFVNDATTALAAKRFLDRNGFPHFEDFILIWNLTELKEILLKDPRLASEYNVFIKQLSQPDLLEWFNQREIKQ
ncbi:MAG: hypothetical protein Q8J65_01770, partial [Nitrosomonadales bacterium]|nr:hypothetical protein [Nitrosomonadales bacterium]